MASTPPMEEFPTRTKAKRKYQKYRVGDGTNVRRSSRVRVQKIDRDPMSDSERVVNGRQRCIRWTTLEKQLLLRTLKEKSAISQFNYLAIKRCVKTKKKSDVEIFIRNLRKRATKAKIESMRKKSPIEIWHDLMNHFGDQDQESMRVMSKVMAMAALEKTSNADEITCDDFKPYRIYRYLGALCKSRKLPMLTPLESQVILDCFENMLEVLKGSEIRDKAALLRSQYFTLYNRAYAGGNEYGLEDHLSVVYRETEGETGMKANQPSSVSSQPGTSRTEPSTLETGTDLASSSRNPEANGPGLQTIDLGPGTSGNIPGSSGVRQNGSGPKRRASWQGGVDRSLEVRLLNPLGIPVEMLEFKPRDDESHVTKRWTYVDTTDYSDSDDGDGDTDSFDDEEDDSHDLERRKDQVKGKGGRPHKGDRAGTDQDNAQDTARTCAGEPNEHQEMTELLNTDQFALVTEEEFARKGEVYLRAMADAHTDTDSPQDIAELVGSDQYVFISKDELATEGDRSVMGMEEVERGEDEVQETGDMDDTCQPTATGRDYLHLEQEFDRQELSSTQLESEQYVIDDQAENDDSSGNEGSASEIDQSEMLDDDMGPSDGEVDMYPPDEFRARMSAVGDKDGSNAPENTLPTSAATIHLRSPVSKQEGDGITDVLPSAPALSVVKQPSRRTIVQYLPQTDCHWIERPSQGVSPQSFHRVASEPKVAMQASGSRSLNQISPVLPVVSHKAAEATPVQVISSDQSVVSNPLHTDVTQVLPNQHFQVASNSPSKRMDDADIPSRSPSKLQTDRSDTSGNVKSKPVRFRLCQKKSQPNESSSQEPPGDSTPKTIPLVNAIDTGIVGGDKSDDQLLTIDLSQLGPDSNIVIPSYLLPGGILTIRSPNVARMGIQRSDPSLSLEAGSNSAVSNNDMDVSRQSWDGTSHKIQLHESIPVDTGPGSDEESSDEDDISQTEYVIASDEPSKESHDLCEVHVIANHIKKPNNPAEVPLKPAPEEQQITKQVENSSQELQVTKKPENSKEMRISKKVEASNRLEGIQSVNAQPETEERSFLEFLSSQTPAWKLKEQSTTERGCLMEGNVQPVEQNVHAQAVHNVNIPISKSSQDKNKGYEFTGSEGLIGVARRSGCHPQANASIQPNNQASLGRMGQGTPHATSLHDTSLPKMRSSPPPVVPGEVTDNQVIRNEASSGTDLHLREKRKRGRPRKYEPSTDERLPLASEMQQVGSDSPSTESKRKRGRPRKIDSRVPVGPEDLVPENEDTHGHSEEGLDEQEASASPKESEDIGERVVAEKRKRGRPPKYVEGKSVLGGGINAGKHSAPMSSMMGNRQPGDLTGSSAGVFSQSETDFLAEGLEKRKRGRPKKESKPDSFSISSVNFGPDQTVEREAGIRPLRTSSGTDSDTESKEKRKRGRPCKEAQPGSLGEIGSGWPDNESGTGKELKRKRGRPRKELRPDSVDDLPDSSVICQSAENDIGSEWSETEPETESKEKQKRERPHKESRQNVHDDLQDRITASTSTVGISKARTVKTALKRMTELKGDHSKEVIQDKAKTSIIETDVMVTEGEKRKRGRPPKRLRTDSLEKSIVSPRETVNKSSIDQIEAVSQTKIGETRKRGRPRKESIPNSFDDSPDRTVANQATENAEDTGHLETHSRTGREETDKGGQPSLEFIPNNPNPATDVKTGSEQCLAERAENDKEGQCKPEIRPAPTYVLFYRVINHPSAVENKTTARRYREIRPAPPKEDKVTSNPSVERKASIGPLSAGADSGLVKQGRRRRPLKNVQKDVTTTKDTPGSQSKSAKATRKSRRTRPSKEFQVNSSSDRQSSKEQGQSKEPDTSNNHVADQENAEGIKMHSGKKETTVLHADSVPGVDQKQKRGRSRKAVKPEADVRLSRPEKQKRGRPSKRVDTRSSDIDVENNMIKNQSSDKGRKIYHTEIASIAGVVEDSTTDWTLVKARVDSTSDLDHDVPQPVNSEASINSAVNSSRQEMEVNGSRPHEKSGFDGAPHKTSLCKTLPASELSIDQTPSEVVKQALLSNDSQSNASGTHQSLGKTTKSILKKHKKRGPLRVIVGKELADKRQKSLASAKLSQSHSIWSQSAPVVNPVSNILHEGDLLFGKPKKRVSFEDAIDLVDTLGEGEVLGKDLLMTDIVSQTAMKEVLKIVKEVSVDRESILAPQPPKKTSVFFSIKKS